MNALLEESRKHLGDLIEACQRCTWHLNATAARVEWPLTATKLSERQMDLGLFVQDLLGTICDHRLCEAGAWSRAG